MAVREIRIMGVGKKVPGSERNDGQNQGLN